MEFPPVIRAFVERSRCDPVHIGKSNASVFKVTTSTGILFLKTCPLTADDRLSAEAERLQWLAGKAAVPRVVSFARDDEREYLLLTALPGLNGIDAGRERPRDVAYGLGKALRSLHAVSIDGCPFDQSVAAQIERARDRVHAGLVDEWDFDDERRGRSAVDVFAQAEAEASRLVHEEQALTHGDPCLPNVMFHGPALVGFIDCGRAGVADPYQDLALAARSIRSNLGEDWVAAFFDAYGVPQPDECKLAFYRLLDEFF